ncbi:heavy-metal-associated domain-containing protein [Costertonia aggregata]|uniref:Heavy metal translocating P-type ATPase n=1 Tax=Costertonia aggregata TaxID=343403 RepID=A0A7H9AQW1_9FLAO|nr:heavy-metal-associated domain-containing protein [Costertonia aggregata]QLG45814.1 heavy metal translocating P-type ATPase [Costertonia aggregata]
MKHTYIITGMTCGGCVASVTEKISKVSGVQNVEVNLEKSEAQITMREHIGLDIFKSALPDKYSITDKKSEEAASKALNSNLLKKEKESEPTKLQQLKPLLLIFLYLFSAAFLLNYKDWSIYEAMLDFMGLFYIVFSFFKLLDLKGFPDSFRMYDPLAKAIPAYGRVYPFLELILGLLFLMRLQVTLALIATIVILGITTVGVTKTLLDKKSIRCACLGTALKLPMTEATFIENAIMLVMAITMLFQTV